jgi:hypothetical protein
MDQNNMKKITVFVSNLKVLNKNVSFVMSGTNASPPHTLVDNKIIRALQHSPLITAVGGYLARLGSV